MSENTEKKAKLDNEGDWENDMKKQEEEEKSKEEKNINEENDNREILSEDSFVSKNRRKLIFLLGTGTSLALAGIPLFYLLSSSQEKSKKNIKLSKADIETLKFQNKRYFDRLMNLRSEFKSLKKIIQKKESIILSELNGKNFEEEKEKISKNFEKLEKICINIDSKLICLGEDILLNKKIFNTTFVDFSYIRDTLEFIENFDIKVFLNSYSFEDKPFKTVEFLISEFYERLKTTSNHLSDAKSRIRIV